jgi:DNA-binding CsgD family transcriptional regulator
VREELPDGPDTAPGNTILLTGLALQRVAATLALRSGDLPAARAWLDANDRWLAWSGAVLGRAEAALGWATYHRAAGDLGAARVRAESGLAHASEPRQPLALLAAHRLLGELATADARLTDAQTHLAAALTLADACADPYERATTLLALVALRLNEGKPNEATADLDNARVILASVGAAPALALADALAQRLIAPLPATQTEEFPFGLTAREVEVLRLVAEGLTDPQIGEQLFVSRHTVNAHLRGVYGKLGVNTRTAAARLAAAQGII